MFVLFDHGKSCGHPNENDEVTETTEFINYNEFDDKEYPSMKNVNNESNKDKWINLRRNNIQWLRRSDIENDNGTRGPSNEEIN